MGWKSFRDGYQIGHLVQVTTAGVCIGSPYVHDIIVVQPDGTISKRYGELFGESNADLNRYQAEIEADPAKAAALIAATDVFERDLVIYAWQEGGIVEAQCEIFAWPNCTHDGRMIYENSFFATPEEAAADGVNNYLAAIESWERSLAEKRKAMDEIRERQVESERNLAKLSAAYPGLETAIRAKRQKRKTEEGY